MTCLEQICAEKNAAGEYASREDICRVFTENVSGLYQLSLCLTGDPEIAEECFVAGLDDAVEANDVFKAWAHAWAKRDIIRNAIRALKPQPAGAGSPAPADVISGKGKLRIIRDGHLEMDSVLALEDFERFVYVITVLERYSDHDCAELIGCPVEAVRAARIHAVQEIARIACNAPLYQVLPQRESGQVNAEDKPQTSSDSGPAPLVA